MVPTLLEPIVCEGKQLSEQQRQCMSTVLRPRVLLRCCGRLHITTISSELQRALTACQALWHHFADIIFLSIHPSLIDEKSETWTGDLTYLSHRERQSPNSTRKSDPSLHTQTSTFITNYNLPEEKIRIFVQQSNPEFCLVRQKGLRN